MIEKITPRKIYDASVALTLGGSALYLLEQQQIGKYVLFAGLVGHLATAERPKD